MVILYLGSDLNSSQAESSMDILTCVAARVADYTIAPICHQLTYLFCYKENVKVLETRILDLKNVKERLQHQVAEAQRNGENIEACVSDWFTKVDKIITEYHDNFTRGEQQQANTKCICGVNLPNLVLRHRLSVRAKKVALNVAAQIQDTEKIKKVSYCRYLPNSVENKGFYEGFESRSQTMKGIIEALRDPSVGMVGVWGMGGVGKTMLAKEVARRAKDEENLFTKAVFTTISKDQNIEKIQQEIGEKLGMQFREQNKDVRAVRLQNRLRQESALLIILDDIWDQLDLEDVGISFGLNQRGCKMFFISRSYHVLANKMDVDRNVIFAVGVLLEREAMSLFHKIVGDLAEKHDDFQDLATRIVKECGGLPLAITTVASALKNKGCAVWKNALQELRKSNPINIQDMHEKVYTSIKFSYDYLKGLEAKHLLLLCSLFPEDANIGIIDLCNYGFGLNLFEDVNTLEEARNKTDALVTNLKDHSLLLDGDSGYGHDVKLHDVIRAIVIFIASKLDDHHRMHNIRNSVELDKYVIKGMFKDSTAISLYDIKADQYPQTLTSPELKLLRLVRSYGKKDSGELQHQFFEGQNKLLVLDLVRVSLESLPAASSFCLLPNLQTLCLFGCNLGDISWIGELKYLKILDLSSTSITELPRAIGKLNRLLSLNLQNCSKLKAIEPNVISSLTRLEELNLKDSFTNWEVERVVNGDERQNASLSEVKNLPHLIDLNLNVPDINSLPKNVFSVQLKKYYIIIGGDHHGRDMWQSCDVIKNTSRILKLKLCPNSVLNEHNFEALLKKSDALYLNGLKCVKSVAFEIDNMGFQRLKHLTVEESNEIRCIVNLNNGNVDYLPGAFPSLESLVLRRLKNLENIIHVKLTTETWFGKLREIEVSTCDKMKSLFSLCNMPKQLESIIVKNCKMMEEIISYHGREEGDHVEKIEISQLQSLRLIELPKLVQFKATRKSDGQSIDDSVALLFNGQVVFPKLNLLSIYSLNIQKIWNDDQLVASRYSFQNVTTIEVWACDHLESLIPSIMIASLVHLRSLYVESCEAMKEIVFIEESTQVMKNYISFPKLESLKLSSLPNLERFCGGDCVECPSLSNLTIRDCLKLRVFIPNTMPMTTTKNEDENSTGSVDKQHHSYHKDAVKVELSTESCCSEITCQPHPLCSVEEHDDMVFKTKCLSVLKLCNFPYLRQLPKTFQTVKLLSICGWDIRLKDFVTPLISFQNLKVLLVKDCHGLTSLFSPLTAKSLSQQLTQLGISGCKSLRQVIANDHKEAHDHDDHENVADNINIIFSQLKILVLHDLSNLTSFYSGNNNNVVLQFPHLDKLIVGACPEMKTFCHGNIHCPSLHKITLCESITDQNIQEGPEFYDGIHMKHSFWKGDINTTIQKLWEDKNTRDSPESEENVENTEEDHVVGP